SIHRMETGALRPTDEVAKKMERELGIKLFEKVDAVVTKRQTGAGMTLGDILRDAMKGKGKGKGDA
ncbi:MAG TPA: hypothetical protein VI818_03870, partial [Candidatus Thermoplasmatota archaeon]|nr:hypothetical protein [Candidatus Thermoplasmatota archaeon]